MMDFWMQILLVCFIILVIITYNRTLCGLPTKLQEIRDCVKGPSTKGKDIKQDFASAT